MPILDLIRKKDSSALTMFAGEKRKMAFKECTNWKWKAREKEEDLSKDGKTSLKKILNGMVWTG